MELFYGGNYILSCITSYNETIYQFVCKIISNSTDVEHASKMQINICNKTKDDVDCRFVHTYIHSPDANVCVRIHQLLTLKSLLV